MRTVLIGIAPGKKGWEGQPLSALAPRSTGRKISDMIGIGWSEYMQTFDRINVCPFAQPGTIKAKEWTSAAENLAGSILRGRRVILLGQNVAECFGIKRDFYEYCTWHECRNRFRGIAGFHVGLSIPFDWAVVPHPSGRNLWYNDQAKKKLASDFLREEFERTKNEDGITGKNQKEG